MTTSVSFFQLGDAFAKSANFLGNAFGTEPFKVSDSRPVDFLYAHALELILKGSLLEADSTTNVEEFDHDLLKLYDEVKSNGVMDNLICAVEQAVRDKWKWHLRDARDTYKEVLGLGHIPKADSEEFGIFDNEAIGRELPELRKLVIWLNDRHSYHGGKFRYPHSGLDSRLGIQAFGLSENVAWKTAHWACEEMYNRFRSRRRTIVN